MAATVQQLRSPATSVLLFMMVPRGVLQKAHQRQQQVQVQAAAVLLLLLEIRCN
jgi:hypothetical protein